MANTDTPPVLLTPGPLTTSSETKAAMSRDWGSRDTAFIAMTVRVCRQLAAAAGAQAPDNQFVCVPLQGSGTFIVEAVLDTLIPRKGKALILVNGAYGHRMAEICRYNGRDVDVLEFAEDCTVDPGAVEAALRTDAAVTHVAVVHCETTSGILNPLEAIAAVVKDQGRKLIIDAMSSFGAIPLDVSEVPCVAVAASANKCLEGVPGVGFAIIDRDELEGSKGNSTSLSLDLWAQHEYLTASGQWRFTPPTHVIAALDEALRQFEAEGGVAGRHARYQNNYNILAAGMTQLGFERFLDDDVQAPIIVTFHAPNDPRYDFDTFYDHLKDAGYAIYPGKLTKADSFRIGCIGAIGEAEMEGVLSAIAGALDAMDVRHRGR